MNINDPRIIRNREKYIGKYGINNNGLTMIIEKYFNNEDIWVRFTDTNNLVHTTLVQFNRGSVKDTLEKSVFGLACVGVGNYKVSENSKNTPQYRKWFQMLTRVFDIKYHKKFPSYKNCTVADEWLNFQNFAKWFDENYYEIDGERMCLDKDILFKGNKLYSSETCVFVPERINLLFTRRFLRRGKYPIGVHWNKYVEKYEAACVNNGKHIYLGYFDTPENAFYAYKLCKEKIIKQIAEEYKDIIPYKLYEAMNTYQVEIND